MDGAVGPAIEPVGGQAGDLVAEQQDIVLGIGWRVATVAAVLGHQPGFTGPEPGQEVAGPLMDLPGQMWPIIQAGAVQGLVAEIEATGPDDVQLGAITDAQAADIAGIARDLGLKEGEVHGVA